MPTVSGQRVQPNESTAGTRVPGPAKSASISGPPSLPPDVSIGPERDRRSTDRLQRRSAFKPFYAFSSSSGLGWSLGVIALLTVTAIYSIEPAKRLVPNPPAEFLTLHTGLVADEQLFATGYWGCARNLPYSHALALPVEPPPQFGIPEEHGIPRDVAVRIRRLYWNKLQKIWLEPGVWETAYTWRRTSQLYQMAHDVAERFGSGR